MSARMELEKLITQIEKTVKALSKYLPNLPDELFNKLYRILDDMVRLHSQILDVIREVNF